MTKNSARIWVVSAAIAARLVEEWGSGAQFDAILLGAAAAGYDLGDCRADLGRLLGEELAPQVRTAVEALYPGGRIAVGQPAYAQPTAGLQLEMPPAPALPLDDDPLAGVGIEV